MHRPPAVHFTVRRSRWQERALFSVWLLGLGAMLTFFQYQEYQAGPTFAVAVWGVALLFSTGLALRAWRQAPSSGLLHWNGDTWYWSGFGQDVPCAAVLCMDCQWWLIVSLQRAGAPKVWLWLDAAPADPGWRPLRRALVGTSGLALTDRPAGASTGEQGLE